MQLKTKLEYNKDNLKNHTKGMATFKKVTCQARINQRPFMRYNKILTNSIFAFTQVGAPSFRNGTTNGAAWYPLTGGMQDYNYIWHGCMEVTLELSCCKFPPAEELAQFWDDNRASMLLFLGEAHRGVKGFVKNNEGVAVEGAAMKVIIQDIYIEIVVSPRDNMKNQAGAG